MLPPSRNAPCPCGSGRKYKHCCLPKASGPGVRSGSDRDRAWSRLVRFAGGGPGYDFGWLREELGMR